MTVVAFCSNVFGLFLSDDDRERDDIEPDEYDLDLDLDRDESYDDLEYDRLLRLLFLSILEMVVCNGTLF